MTVQRLRDTAARAQRDLAAASLVLLVCAVSATLLQAALGWAGVPGDGGGLWLAFVLFLAVVNHYRRVVTRDGADRAADKAAADNLEKLRCCRKPHVFSDPTWFVDGAFCSRCQGEVPFEAMVWYRAGLIDGARPA